MTLTYILKKTDELSAQEKERLCGLFANVFNQRKSIGAFINQFEKTVFGYSYHGLMLDDNQIVGSYTSIPFKYRYYGQEMVFALSVDTMINEKHRGNPYALKKMANLVYEALQQDNVPFVFGFPNEKVYLVRKKVLRWVDIGELDYYVLPINIGAVMRRLSVFNALSRLYSFLINRIPKQIERLGKLGGSSYNIEKIGDAAFMDYRFDGEYELVKLEGSAYFAYRIVQEEGIRTAYLIDISPIAKRLIESAVKHIWDKERDRIDLILYLGKLGPALWNLYKIPKRIEPKKIRMAGKILIESMVDKRIFDIKNWNINLSNFDVR